MKKKIVVFMAALTFITMTAPAFGYDQDLALTLDVLTVRPVSLAATVVGTAIFIVALPFALTSRSVQATVQTLVVVPFRYTFVRPIGDFDGRWEQRKVSGSETTRTEPASN